MSVSTRTRSLGGTLARTRQWHPDRDTTEIETELATSKISDRVKEIVASAPPLSAEQRSRIAALLVRPQ